MQPRFRYEHHLTNYKVHEPVMRAMPMGEGIIDYEMFIGTLKDIGYQGYIVYESVKSWKPSDRLKIWIARPKQSWTM